MRFTVTAERTPRGWWVLESDNGAVSQVRRLDQVEDEMREAIAYLAEIPEDQVEIDVKPALDGRIIDHMTAAADLRELSDRAKCVAAAMSRVSAVELQHAGLTVRDVGIIMKVSHQRAQQLITEGADTEPERIEKEAAELQALR